MMNSPDFGTLLGRIRSRLPLQNPLHSFVHNNILQMFEDLDFHDAMRDAGELYRAKTYWPLERYKTCYREKKITDADIMRALEHYSGRDDSLPFLPLLGITRKDFFYRLMFSELNFNDDEPQPELDDERLWIHCREKVKDQSLILSRSPVRLRAKSYWEKNHNVIFSQSIHPFVTRLMGSYLDQGQSYWSNPFKEEGFWKFLEYDLEQTGNFLSGWQKIFAAKVKQSSGKDPGMIILDELRTMQIPEDKHEAFLLEILFDLRGWSGMVNKLEMEPWQATVRAPKIQLADFIAAMLFIESSVDTFFAGLYSLDVNLLRCRKEEIRLSSFQLSLALYQITKSMNLDQRWVQRLSREDALSLIDGVDSAEQVHMIRLWHESFEHQFHHSSIQALMARKRPEETPTSAQVLCCIDDREESLRRHIEEVAPRIKTFGVVGFFGLDMKFRSHKHDRLIAQCPPVVKPSRIVTEIALDDESGTIFRRINNFLGISDLAFYYQSRTLLRGVISTLVLGTASIVPMFFQVFFPEKAKKLKGTVLHFFSGNPRTEIRVEKTDESHGYDVNEMAGIVKTIFGMCGIQKFARIVILLGHGSSSNNNPFRQAYGCGACGGNSGIPNSRGFAKMANDPRVRKKLAELGVLIPDTTRVIAGFHDTCTDEISYYDLESHSQDERVYLQHITVSLNEACRRNAHERCQKFSDKNARTDATAALEHVRERALDPAQPRPEYGHSRNALAIVAPRDLTRGLFLNRRSFLLSYDWQQDPDGKILSQVVLGGVPVCVNINMDYYFSLVDNENFGSGSKLPLNLTGLLGVMTGSQGDLRIGLAKQMVEIHEPLRNLTVIEAPLERVQRLFASHPRLKNILEHHWFRLVVHDPITDKWLLYGNGNWSEVQHEDREVISRKNSQDVFQNHPNLDFAEIIP